MVRRNNDLARQDEDEDDGAKSKKTNKLTGKQTANSQVMEKPVACKWENY